MSYLPGTETSHPEEEMESSVFSRVRAKTCHQSSSMLREMSDSVLEIVGVIKGAPPCTASLQYGPAPCDPDVSLRERTHAGRGCGPVASKMDLDVKKTSSQALLSCGSGGGLSEKLLLKPKAGRSLQTERVPRSSVLERLQSFLPQMAEANEKLKQQMDDAPAGRFDIESVEGAERVIEMDVALVELSGSDADSDAEDKEETSDSEEESDSGGESEVAGQKLVLPGDKGKKKKANIQVLHPQAE